MYKYVQEIHSIDTFLLKMQTLIIFSPLLCEGSNAAAVGSMVVDEVRKEKMRPGHWLGSLNCVSFS